ncbi:MAG: hypothetical protein CMN32_15145 [Saprospirales bacterium]|nr:hypothetical protein [Saprospirales bacterium]
MKSIFIFIFNIIRNVSLLLVILFFCFAFFLEKYPEQVEKWFEIDSAKLSSQIGVMEQGPEDDFFPTQSFDIPKLDSSINKLSIPAKNGTAFLRANQILYIDTDTLLTTNHQKVAISSSLASIDSLLKKSNESFFFRTKSYILNCDYIMQVVKVSTKHEENKYSYQNFAVMEDGEWIAISKKKSQELMELLEKISI